MALSHQQSRHRRAIALILLNGTALLASSIALADEPAPPKVTFPTVEDFPVAWPAQPVPATDAPNVLVIMTDDQGFGSSSTFGGLIPTPNFDRLAREGLRYNNFNTAGICSPTRAALLTGRYPHNVGMGALSDIAAGYEGYTSVIPPSAVPVARILRDHGYGTAMFGKAHITPPWELSAAGPFDRWPTGLGFQYFYGFLQGDTNQFAPNLVENTRSIQPPADANYFFEKDIADRTIGWMREQDQASVHRPFFIYYAPGATHAPHHAPADWIARFKGRFDEGWDRIRARIFAQQKATGIVPRGTKLTPRPAELPAWDSLSADDRRLAARFMEAYAAHLAFVDAQIGRVIDELDRSGKAANTMVVLIQGDNGASGEGGIDGTFFEQSLNFGVPENKAYSLAEIDKIGGPLSDNMYPAGWAWAMNTPFRWFKQNASHFGGVRNGLVIRWPGRLENPGAIRPQFGHVSDIVPTILDAAGIAAPQSVDGVVQKPMDGISLTYTFADGKAPARRKTQYFEILENAAIYHDGWVAATRPAYMPWQLFSATRPRIRFNDRHWELYHVDKDFSEAVDLAAKEPARLAALQRLFLEEGKRNNLFPLHQVGEGSAGRPGAVTRTEYAFGPEATNVHVSAAPALGNRAFDIVVDATVATERGNGVMVAQGGRFNGFSLYLKDGVPSFTYNAIPPRIQTVRADRPVSAGAHRIAVRFERDDGAKGGGTVRFSIDGADAGGGAIPVILPRVWFTEGLDVGKDLLTPVSPDYDTPASFPGEIASVRFKLR